MNRDMRDVFRGYEDRHRRVMRRLLAAGLAGLAIFASATAYIVWWQEAHVFINNACGNWIYYRQHLRLCITWNNACGIVSGVAFPAAAVGIVAAVICLIWYFASRMEQS